MKLHNTGNTSLGKAHQAAENERPGEAAIAGKKHEAYYIEDPQKIISQGLRVVVLFFGVLGLWSVFGEISGAVVAPGTVKIDTQRKTVQHLEGGIIEAISVREGQRVVAGETLIMLKSIATESSVEMLQKRLVAALAAQARVYAEKELKLTVSWPEELLELAAKCNNSSIFVNEEKLFVVRKEAFENHIYLLESQMLQVAAQISGLKIQESSTAIIIQTLKEEHDAKSQLVKERYLEKSQVLELRRQLASNQGSLGRIRQSIAELNEKKSEINLRIRETKTNFVMEASGELSKLETEILQLRDQILPHQDARERLRVVAPVSGRVVDLKVNSTEGVISPGMALMDIVPENTPLIVETHIPVNKVADIFVEQKSQVQLDAFDTRTTPLLKGHVNYISADRLEDRSAMEVVPYYLCYIQVDPQSVAEANIYLSPGMPATVFITTKTRTVLHYMLEPLLKSWDSSLRD